MEFLNTLFDFFRTAEITVPAPQIALLLVLSTVSLLLGRLRLALLVNYVFTLYWGYMFNQDFVGGLKLEQLDLYTYIYFGFGFLVIFFALIGFLIHRQEQ